VAFIILNVCVPVNKLLEFRNATLEDKYESKIEALGNTTGTLNVLIPENMLLEFRNATLDDKYESNKELDGKTIGTLNVLIPVNILLEFRNATLDDKYESNKELDGKTIGTLNVLIPVNVLAVEILARREEEPAVAIQLARKNNVIFAPRNNNTIGGLPPIGMS